MSNFVKVMGIKFDALEGLRVVKESNQKNYEDAGKFAEGCNDGDTIFVCVPCTYSLTQTKSFL